jgi:23S rRNA (guanine745-N1)-methyltransferase
MNITKAHNLACPIDGAPLKIHGKHFDCENGHVFDIARQGYVNLLPVQHKRSKQPGDSKEMVSARARFLDSGVYESIADRLAEIVFAQISGDKEICLMDAGCGEGYYFNYLFNILKGKEGCSDLSFIGLDISKDAIVGAAKRNKQITWLVGTNRQPPLEPASVDIITCVFGFQSFDGFGKISRPGGRVVLVEPGPEHLKELRKLIYSDVRKTDPAGVSSAEEAGYLVLDRQFLQFKTAEINNLQINDLLLMTPHFYRANKTARETAQKLAKLELTVDIVFTVLEKTAGIT